MLLPFLLSLLAQTEAPSGAPPARLCLHGATVHSMKPGEAARTTDVWIADGRIRALGAAPWSGSDHVTLDVTGKHLVPGLIDAYVNFDPEHDPLYLAAGVTLVRDVGGDRSMLLRERLQEARERGPGPFLLTAGAPLDGDPPSSSRALVLRTSDSVQALLPILLEDTVDFVSILPGLAPEVYRAVLGVAHEHKRAVFGPRPATLTLQQALEAGQDGFHTLDALLAPGARWTELAPDALEASLAALAEAKKPLVPLLHASGARLVDQSTDAGAMAALGMLAPTYESWWRAELDQRRPFLTEARLAPGLAVVARQGATLAALLGRGAVLVPGSGAPQPWLFPGVSLHQELAAWVRAGCTPEEALTAATREAARALGLAGQRGTLEPGAFADLLVLDADPTRDLAAPADPFAVLVRGRVRTRAELAAAVAAVATREAGVRTALAAPLEVAPPPQGEDGVVVLEGSVDSESYGVRVSSERYRVVVVRPGVVLYTGRVLFPASATGGARELTVEQFIERGRLVQVHVELHENGSRLEHDGLWTAGTWRTQSRLDGQVIATPAALPQQPWCYEAGSVTTLLILAQAPLAETIPVVQLHPGLDPEAVNWRSELDDQGDHQLRTNVGFRAFRVDALGAIEFALEKLGNGVVRTRKLGSDGFGGPGHPLPPEKRRPR